jgi:ribokinase
MPWSGFPLPDPPGGKFHWAGDALFSCFLHHYTATGDAAQALRRAVVFASWKIGAASAADGFLDSAGLEALFQEVSGGSSIA